MGRGVEAIGAEVGRAAARTRRAAILVVAALVACAIGAWAASRRARFHERRDFHAMLLRLEGENPAGPRPLRRAFEADLRASLRRTLDVMDDALRGWWLDEENTYEACGRVFDSYGDVGVDVSLSSLEHGDDVFAALECLCGNAATRRADPARVRRAVEPYAGRSDTVGADATAILSGLLAR